MASARARSSGLSLAASAGHRAMTGTGVGVGTEAMVGNPALAASTATTGVGRAAQKNKGVVAPRDVQRRSEHEYRSAQKDD